MNAPLRLGLAFVTLIAPPTVVLVDRSPLGWGVAFLALAALAIFFLLFAGVGALFWLAAGLIGFWRVVKAGTRRSFARAI